MRAKPNPHALQAKVQGLKGKLLTLADYQHLLQVGYNLPQLLTTYPQYTYLSELDVTSTFTASNRSALQNALHTSLQKDITKLNRLIAVGYKPPHNMATLPHVIKKHRKATRFSKNPHHLVTYYLSLKQAEIKNLTTIIEAVAYKKDFSTIRELLIQW